MTKLQEEVKLEAEKLRKFATKEELKLLNLDAIKPTSRKHCIYGQMTGDCFSNRAEELILKCTPVFYDYLTSPDSGGESVDESGTRNWSPIEVYIYNRSRDHVENLVNFLKGKTDELIFS